MDICERLRQFREAKNLSQGDIEKRTGLLRCYISRVENGHTVPSIETLEKISRALEVPMYQLFYNGDESSEEPNQRSNGRQDWTSRGKGHRVFAKLTRALARISAEDRALLLFTAAKMADPKRRRGCKAR
jgi:transcriptional regulator with XRE-family HTH domain